MIVLGAAGLLGSNVVKHAIQHDEEVVGTYHSSKPSIPDTVENVDLRDYDQIIDVLEAYPSGPVINCAAMTDVDECERDPDRASAINAKAPRKIAAKCAEMGRTIVHISTDYVFDGTAESPYVESASTNPIQEYGRSKKAGDQAVRKEATSFLIVRPSFVYGIHNATGELTGFPAWVKSQLESGTNVPLFTDQHVSPTRAGQCAATILELLKMKVTGTVHVASRSCVTPYQFGQLVRKQIDAPATLLAEGSMDDLERQAPRPAYTCLDVSHVTQLLGRQQPTIESDLARIFPD